MNKISKWMTAAAVVAISGTLAFAQNAPDQGGKAWGHDGHRGHHSMARLAQKLNLTDAQKADLKAWNQSFREQNKAFFDSMRATRQEMHAARQAGDTAKVDALKATVQSQRAQMKQLRQQQHEKFLSVLTAEQRAQFDALKAQRQARRQNKQ